MRSIRFAVLFAIAAVLLVFDPGGETQAMPGAGGVPVYSTRGVPPVPASVGDVSFGAPVPGGTCTAADIMTLTGGGPVGPCPLRGVFPTPDQVSFAPADFGLDIAFPGGPPVVVPFSDDLDAISYTEALGVAIPTDFDFSVDAAPADGGVTVGAPIGAGCPVIPSTVTIEAAAVPPEAQGDMFSTDGLPFGCNIQAMDEAPPVGLVAIGPGPGVTPLDDMDALAEFPFAGGPCPLINAGGAFSCPAFSIATGSAAIGFIAADACIASPADAASILVPPSTVGAATDCLPGGCPAAPAPPCIAVPSTFLGLIAGDDLDALCWWDANGDGVASLPHSYTGLFGIPGDFYLFSLQPGNASGFSPAALLSSGPGMVLPPFSGPPRVVVPPVALGLLAMDNVDGLICHDNDTDGDGAPDVLDTCERINGIDDDYDLVVDEIQALAAGDCDGDGHTDAVEAAFAGPAATGGETIAQCVPGDTADDDGDGRANDGCLRVGGGVEVDGTGVNADCGGVGATALDDDGDGTANDGCPGVGPGAAEVACADVADNDMDNVINDGCVGGFSDHQSRCGGLLAWPLDVTGNGVINIADVGSFVLGNTPHFNQLVANHDHWDLSAGGGATINIGDVGAYVLGGDGTPARPPMFSNQRAWANTTYGVGGTCPPD